MEIRDNEIIMDKDKFSSIVGISIDEFRKDMEELKKSNDAQAKYAKKQYHQTMISTIAVLVVCISMLGSGLLFMPKINYLLNNAITSLENINQITSEISKVDFEGLIDDVGGLVTTTEKDLEQTMKTIEAIDIEGLNDGIANLTAVIEPLAEFFGR